MSSQPAGKNWYRPHRSERVARRAGNRTGTCIASVLCVLLSGSSAAAQDEQRVPLGQGFENLPCVLQGSNSTLESTPAGDDTIVAQTILTGDNGICESTLSGDDEYPAGVVLGGGTPDAPIILAGTAEGICNDTIVPLNDDVVIVPVGQSKPRQAAIRGGNDNDIDSVVAGDDVVTSVICDGADNLLQSTPSGDDLFASAFSGLCPDVCLGPLGACIIPGDDDVLDSTVDPLDLEEPYVSTGSDGVADTTAAATDVELIAVGDGWPFTSCVTAGPDGIADTTLCGNSIADYDENGIPDNTPTDCEDGNTTADDGCNEICITEVCGDGVLQPGLGEECDDGPANSNTIADACRTTCVLPSCGDGVADAGELCDDGNDTNGDGCDDDVGSGGNCTPSACGNGVVAGSEVCDDGNVTNGDGCDDGVGGNCTVTACGNGVVTAGEACDDANSDNDDPCLNSCVVATCGDGFQCTAGGCNTGPGGGTEDCDDGAGNSDSTPDACRTDCALPSCGDGTTDSGEDCDDSGESATCDPDCTTATCGDGTLNTTAGEQCDDANANNNDPCLNTCVPAACGDGVLCSDGSCNTGPGNDPEECDDGGANSDVTPDACRTSCALPGCGDGTTDSGESCDDAGESALCDVDCTPASCGDATTNATAGEDCDDANANNNDPCLDTCIAAACGDGILCSDAACTTAPGNNPEQCDDGGANSDTLSDACRTTCEVASCGDGTVDVGNAEECDDGDNQNNDFCVQGCVNAVCGDGFKWQGAEECDDGNVADGDGCSAICFKEPDISCGNGVVDTACSAGQFGQPCTTNVDCDSVPAAGDGVCEFEVCDDNNNSNKDDCTNDCELPVCGDGFLHTKGTPPFEQCDDGGTTPGDGCGATCLLECGNGQLDGSCSQPPSSVGTFCLIDSDCDSALAAGDGVCQVDEECDTSIDGICIPGPQSCSEDCTITTCGNNVVECSEECDLGVDNGVEGSGCTILCEANLIGTNELKGKRECPGAWLLLNPPREVRYRTQRCDDGAACDNDALPGQCTFNVSYCLNRPLPLGCLTGTIGSIDLERLDVSDPDKVFQADAAEELTTKIAQLSPSASIPSRCVAGLKGKICDETEHETCDTFFGALNGECDPTGTGVLFSPALNPPALGGDQSQQCTTPSDIVVPVNEKLRLRTLIRRDGLGKDRDRLKLICR